MPFQKGNKLGGGKRNYTLEETQVEKMRKILDRDLALMKKLHDKVEKGLWLNEQEERLMQLTGSRIAKIYDKLHASKSDLTSDGKQINIVVAKEIAEQNGINTSTSNDSKGPTQI